MALFGRRGGCKRLILWDCESRISPKSAVVKTYPIPWVDWVRQDSRRHVFTANPTQERRQDACLLEHRRESASRRWPGRAAASPVFGRDRFVSSRGLAQGDRGVRRGRRRAANA